MSLLNDASYFMNILEAAGAYGIFRAGKSSGIREGVERAKEQTNEAQGLTIEAQAARIDILEKERAELAATVNEMKVKLNYLEELVLRATAQVVQPRVVVEQRG
jgi:SMC interacting uncharacterized protein involved in chromosome segregation